ncbi:MAG: class I SAM-dependent methyltransferase [Myxococcota bacterium]
MSLHLATDESGHSLGLPSGPVPCVNLIPLVGVEFGLPCDDPWLTQSGDSSHAYLDAAARQWQEHPDFMDFLDLHSPVYDLKRAERDLYLHHWGDHLSAKKVLDVGCGIGRMSMPFLERGAHVTGVDGDIHSLRRFAWHAAGRSGSLDLHHSSVQKLPDSSDFDLIIACEVLCYVPDIEPVLAGLVQRLRPGGVMLLSWEAPYGWATAEDAPEGAMEQALAGPGILDLEGDRWVRTVSDAQLAELLRAAGLVVDAITPTHYTFDGPLERCMCHDLSLERLLRIEQQCRQHPVWAPLNRIWTAVAHRPHQAMRASEEA